MKYRLEHLTFKNASFNTAVQRTYLITLETSSRRSRYMRQLARARPTKHVTIVHNAGDATVSPAEDLWHANQFVARLALQQAATTHETHILILEDDVEFTSTFRSAARTIESFLRTRRVDAYSLGMLSFGNTPLVNARHLRVFSGGFSHAVLYSYGALRRFQTFCPRGMLHDVYVYANLVSYTSSRACTVQRYEQTANSKQWEAQWDVLRVVATLNAAFGDDPKRVFRFYDAVNASGGVVPVAAAVLGVLVVARHITL